MAGQRLASSARELMRSRFTAHALDNAPYLHRTFAPTAGKPFIPPSGRATPMNWTRLAIHHDAPGPSPDLWYVEFSAFYHDRNGEHEMRERSEFRRIADQWLYTRAVPSDVK